MVEITDEVIADFRRMMPAFDDTAKWSDYIVRLQMTEADAQTGGRTWGTYRIENDRCLKKRGMYYLCAHFLVSFYGTDGSDPTNIQPEARLNVASKSVGDENISYRITAMETTEEDFLSTTIYGVMYRKLRHMACCTPMCV